MAEELASALCMVLEILQSGMSSGPFAGLGEANQSQYWRTREGERRKMIPSCLASLPIRGSTWINCQPALSLPLPCDWPS